MRRIIWLASYPKSGNTWLRIFLTNLNRDDETPASINDLTYTATASRRDYFDEVVGYNTGLLTHDEIDRLRPEVYAYEARFLDEPLYVKTHDAYTHLPDGSPLFPPEVTKCAVYLIRNPMDVCLSYVHHQGHKDINHVIDFLGDKRASIASSVYKQAPQIRQRLLSWSDHVLSWVEAPGIRCHIMRYEDMNLEPFEAFSAVVDFLELDHDRARIERALEMSSLEVLKKQEQTEGFREKLPNAPSFFRRGQVGSWRESLTDEQVHRIIDNHRDVMRRFGYLTENDEPVF